LKVKTTLPKLYEITWRDSVCNNSPWFSVEDALVWAKQEAIMQTVGYFVHEDKHTLTLAQSLYGSKSFGGLWGIPIGCIIKRKRLK